MNTRFVAFFSLIFVVSFMDICALQCYEQVASLGERVIIGCAGSCWQFIDSNGQFMWKGW
jgi:hypothetical protein